MAINTETLVGDPSVNKPILISSVPTGSNFFSFTSGTLPASTQLTIVWTTTPAQPQLSLWNFHYTVRFGADTAGKEWPNGSGLTADQSNIIVTNFTEALESNDKFNVRINKIVMRNPTATPQTFYMYFKSFSFANSVGGTV